MQTLSKTRINLAKKLRRKKVANLATDGGCAEAAAHATADLAGYTNGVTVLVAHKHAFHTRAVMEGEEVLDRAVYFGHKLFLDLW